MSEGLMGRVRRIASLLADPRAPKLPKLAVLAALVYAVVPIDLVPEAVLPVVGYLDDLLVAWAALRWLVKAGPGSRPAVPGTAVPLSGGDDAPGSGRG